MQIFELSIGGSSYRLRSADAAEAARRALTEAISTGGGFVDLDTQGDSQVSVLVSPGVVAVLEVVEVEDQSPGEELFLPDPPFSWPDFDGDL